MTFAISSPCPSLLPTLGPNVQASSENQGRTPSESQGQTPFESQGQTPSESQGQTPFEKQGQTLSENQRQTPSEIQGQTPSENQEQTPSENQGQTPSENQGQTLQQETIDYWLQCVREWYPRLQDETYFLPLLHFNRVHYDVENIAGQCVLVPNIAQGGACQNQAVGSGTRKKGRKKRNKDRSQNGASLATPSASLGTNSGTTTVPFSQWPRDHGNLVPSPVYDSDVRDDKALQRVLHCLRALADNSQPKEVMMVVSQLQFGRYLGEPSYAAAATFLPRPSTLPQPLLLQHYDKGDFDVLIIHRQHGLFTLEIKSVGDNFNQLKMTEQQEDDVVMKKVREAVAQLNKSDVVLKHLVSDLADVRVAKILVMPNVTKQQLQRANTRCLSLGQDLCQCLGVQNVDDAVKMCLLSDQLSDQESYWNVTPPVLASLREWWQVVVQASGPHPSMTSSQYELLLARFCGPATTVKIHCITAPRLELRTRGEAVSETGERMAALVLVPEQVELLNRSPRRVFISGPPGTGKTVVLILQGLTWLRSGHDVHVVSMWPKSRAVSIAIERQLQETVGKKAKSRVHRHQWDLKNIGQVNAPVNNLKSESKGRQLCVLADEAIRSSSKELFSEVCERLFHQIPDVCLWGASMHNDIRPSFLEEVRLTTPLRSPPVVIREVMQAREIKDKQVHDYTISDVSVPTDGPEVWQIKHRDGQLGHRSRWSRDCVECGRQVAGILVELNVGMTGRPGGPPPLHYRDVLVICYGNPTDDQMDSSGRLTQNAIDFVRGLRERHVPLRVVDDDEDAIRDMALGTSDLVIVTDWSYVQGLERKVVIVENRNMSDRLYFMSRCSSQLVLIDLTESP